MSHPVTIGVLTHNRATTFEKMLDHLKIAVAQYQGETTLIVANNSGAEAHAAVKAITDRSGIADVCTLLIIDSPTNNIAVGRNLVLDNAQTDLLLFIDDDEYPNPDWIEVFVRQHEIFKTMAVAGPVQLVFAESASGWVRQIDLHNNANLKTGDNPPKTGIGNCILDLTQVGDVRMDPADGLLGGEDTAFFQKLTNAGKKITWCEEAMVYETISEERSTARYMIFRFMKQGETFKRVVIKKKSGGQQALALTRAALIAPVCIAIGVILMPFNDSQCSLWLKRGFTNLGKIVSISKPLYGWDGSF